jgi:hypothetical protein
MKNQLEMLVQAVSSISYIPVIYAIIGQMQWQEEP